jgi:hypothetical protein
VPDKDNPKIIMKTNADYNADDVLAFWITGIKNPANDLTDMVIKIKEVEFVSDSW